MAFTSNHKKELNDLLQEYGLDIHMKDTILKKNSAVFNECLRRLIHRYEDADSMIPMYNIIRSLDSIIDIGWLYTNLLDDDNQRRVRDEVIDIYGLSSDKSAVDDLKIFS